MDEPNYQKIQLIMELRRQGITDARVLSALERVPREDFVPEALKRQAYDNIALPIECGQTISQPYVVAFMTQALEIGERDRVLEIGTGSGYQTAILAQLALRVYTIERHRSLLLTAEERFKAFGLSNITTRAGDGSKGWPEAAPFERIVATAAAREAPQALIDQLKTGGILIIPVEERGGDQTLLRITKKDEGIERTELLPVRFVPLVEGAVRDS